ncbi:PAS domain-containing protein [Vibrio mediterranei]|jgi:predicted transcriptional regulator YheO|uniref:helix-turn-helix transcriptional regulator n=1 Tax=Vibrio mediterranei TaxID=689 RepID=UPI001EFD5820|nr:PAS domain-containing protein [Vibrio mediterranei]MCG9628320.1 PAS domain-containing protein [Vibrio mediterranei]MCY9855853.1 PAS domain-containing protein [Vibrio mediterranei]
MTHILEQYIPITKALRALLPSLVEIVIHDLHTNTIFHIENAFTPRKVGDDSQLETENYEKELDSNSLIGPYRKSNPDGTKLKSVSSLLSDPNGEPVGLMCINMQIDGLEISLNHLQKIIAVDAHKHSAFVVNDWRENANSIIAETVQNRGVRLAQTKKEDRLEIVRALFVADIFSSRGSAEYVAEALGVSRASFYQLLKTVKQPQNN